MNREIMKVGKGIKTIAGSLDLGLVPGTDTLHKIKEYELNLMDGQVIKLTYKEYLAIMEGIKNESKFIRLSNGTIFAMHQIKSVISSNKIISVSDDVDND